MCVCVCVCVSTRTSPVSQSLMFPRQAAGHWTTGRLRRYLHSVCWRLI